MNAIQTLLTDHIAIWTDADTEKKSGRGRSSGNASSVYGIRKLRELILELAVRGKLVPQDANDEPASALLKRIQAEKAKLIAEGMIKKDKPLPPITADEKPFELPHGWEWVRFGSIAQHNSGKTLDSGRNTGTLHDYITTSNLYWGSFDLANVRQMPIRDDEFEKCSARKGDLLICEGGEAGRAAVWLYEKEICFQNHIHRARFYCEIDPYYAYRFFERLNATGEINQYRQGVGISNMSGKALASIALSLPPLAEQHRIVAKVDELMALCDQLETRHNNAVAAHEKLVSHLLGTLTQSQKADSPLSKRGAGGDLDWQRIAAHFDTLFTTEASIDALKQTLLQLAVIGKLVPQDPNDEPASALLKRIQAEKAKLIAEMKIKKDKPLPPIADDEKPFALPQGWGWVRLSEIATQITDGAHHTPEYISDGVPFLSVKNLSAGRLDFTDTRFISPDAHADLTKRCNPEFDDILLTKIGTTGIAVVIDDPRPFSIFVSVALIKLSKGLINRDYLALVINSPFVRQQSEDGTEGVGNKNLVLRKINTFDIPLAPLAEQYRIVAKVDELMALCDQLKTRITAANQLQQKLADVMVEQAVA